MSLVPRAALMCLALASWSCANASRGQAGDACLVADDCAGNLPCVDGVCCATACDQTCESCVLPGLEGTCTAIPAGEDPDGECGTLNCATLYAGWDGNACHWGSTVSADVAACNGARACRSPEEECAASDLGAQASACDSLCQAPVDDTCTGDVPGDCTNLDQGTETCGLGACQVTRPRCTGGVATPCQPDMTQATPEVCNGADDDCDGLVDDDWAEPNEDCASYQNLTGIVTNQFIQHNDLSVFQTGDVDYFRVMATESDAMCMCCDSPTCQDEDFQFNLYITVPAGAGSYELCAGPSCATVGNRCVTVPAGSSNGLVFLYDGSCSTNESAELFVRIRGASAGAGSCSPYLFAYEYATGCYGV